ncbi:MAG: UPF0716 protein FxsA [Pseudohongiellaceae bacterium]|jgi:UPF0716 protein FxsA
MRFIFLCFLVVPIVEMLVLLKVGAYIGAFYTVALVLMTAVIGVTLLKRQGLSAFVRANQKMQAGQMPVAEMGEGLMLAVAGALLLTPGFVTDGIGFMLLTPSVRRYLAAKWMDSMMRKSQVNAASGTFYSQTEHSATSNTFNEPKGSITSEDADIVDGDFREIDETKE